MHKLNVVHGNLNFVCHFPHLHCCHALTFVQTNILVDLDGHARIAGFGAAHISSLTPGVDGDRLSDVALGLVHQYFGLLNSNATKAGDVHAFGVLALEVSPLPIVPRRQAIQLRI
jgi:hypothetical protein